MPSPAQRLAFIGAALFTLVLPIENVFVVPGLGSLSVVAGVIMVIASAPVFLARGAFSLRRPPAVVLVLALYVAWAATGLLWSLESSSTLVYVTTFAQLLVLVVIIWQVCIIEARRQALLIAYLIGCTLALLDGVRNFLAGNEAVFQRFAVSNTDPNDYALALVIGIPMAWELFARRRGWSRFVFLLYVPVSLAAVVLSASRGGALAAAVALLVFPLGFAWLDKQGKRVLMVFALAAVAAIPFVWTDIEPLVSSNIERLGTLGAELTTGTLNERSSIWAGGMAAFSMRPWVGVGGGAFPAAIEMESGLRHPAHNAFISVAVELGVVGLVLFTAIIILAAFPLLTRLSPRTLPSLIMLAAWLLGVMSLTWEFRKPTWLVIAMLVTLRSVQLERQSEPGGGAGAVVRSPEPLAVGGGQAVELGRQPTE